MDDADAAKPLKKIKRDEKVTEKKTFTPRQYQIQILNSAKDHNTIACLGTGTGKTFIAVMLMQDMAYTVTEPSSKKIFFLVPTVPLVHQQAKVIEDFTEFKVRGYSGDMGVDTWDISTWNKEFKEQEVFVMTAEICRIILCHTFLPASEMSLLILDECHRAQGNHPYVEIMKRINSFSIERMPRIFGLSASLINGKCKPAKLEKKLNELEKTLRSTIETASDLTDLQKYGTDPDEFLILYNEDVRDENVSGILKIIDSSISREDCPLNILYGDDIHFFQKPKKCFRQLSEIFSVLGPWCASFAAKKFCEEIDIIITRCESEESCSQFEKIKYDLNLFCKQIDEKSENAITAGNLIHSPSKLRRFLEIFSSLKKEKRLVVLTENETVIRDIEFEKDPELFHLNEVNADKNKSEMQFRGIVFVEQRITAYVLCQFMLEVSSKIPEFSFIKPNYIVGHGSLGRGVVKGETSMSVKMQKQIVHEFREGKCNLLIATSVLEEGMDIRQCNVVIRFDLPKDFRSYVQSKGRARAQNSLYILLCPMKNRMDILQDLCNFKTIENMLLKKCHNRKMPSEDEIQDHYKIDELLPPYKPFPGEDSPIITLSSAVNIISRYCTMLPCDMATKLAPRWNYDKPDDGGSNEAKEYVCTLNLPINSPLRQPIVGEYMKQKKLAKMAAALKACRLLHKIGELNDNLLPFSSHVEDAFKSELEDLEEEDVVDGVGQPGTNKRRQIYEKGIADVFINSLPKVGVPCYLHVLNMDLVVPLAKSLNPRGRPLVNPADTTLGFGILLTRELPVVCEFPIFTKCGKVLVGVKQVGKPLFVNEEDIKSLRNFHRYLFSDVLWMENESIEFDPINSTFSCLIVPVDKVDNEYSISWQTINFTMSHDFNIEKCKTKETVKRPKFSESLFKESVVTRMYLMDYWKERAPEFSYITDIVYELSPVSNMDGNITFKNYYKIKYDVDIICDNQPLLNTERVKVLNMWKPLYVDLSWNVGNQKSKSRQRHEDFREYLVPELCIIHPFTSSLFRKATYLPTVLFRLNYLLLAEQIRHTVAVDVFTGKALLLKTFTWPVFNFEQSDKKVREKLIELGEIEYENHNNLKINNDIIMSNDDDILSFEVEHNLLNHTGPCPSLILQALTTKHAGDEFDLERLETIGDSFLKYSMSVKLYCKYPTFDEGKLTKLRIKLIQNLTLYQQAKKNGLPKYLVHSPFNCKGSWLPPCYISKVEETNKDWRIRQLISDKCVADSVEALIGAYLLSCGYTGALRFMHWLGLSAYVENECGEILSSKWPPEPSNPIVNSNSENIEFMLHKLTSNLWKFEERIGYKFKNEAYLVQAFTHASFSDNEVTDCYQRLEFLGDSVLDYLITRKLYEDPKRHSPGELTDLRSALVNNTYFASLAVKYGYHKNLKSRSLTLYKLIDKYINLLEESDAFKIFKKHGYYLEEVECFELEEVEVPKALGDLFESVAGAIYLDSGMSLDAVWRVYYPMMKPAIEHMRIYIPKSPVRNLLERVPDKKIFCSPIVQNNKTYMKVTLPGGKTFTGVGPNKNVAKRSAAKRAVSYLRKKEFEKESHENPDLIIVE